MKLFAFEVDLDSGYDWEVYAVVAESVQQAQDLIRADYQKTHGEPYPMS